MIFQYFSTSNGAYGKPYGFCFEHPASDVDQLAQLCAEDGVISVRRIRSVDDGKGGRLITGWDKVIIGAGSIATIQTPTFAHWEAPANAA